MDEIEETVCTGIHEGRKLLFTDGLPESAYEGTTGRAESLNASREANRNMLQTHADSARQGIRSIEQAFQNALNLKNDPEVYRADRGVLVNSTLWKVGRVEEPKLFHKIFRQENSTIVLDLLIDASGSQSCRQAMVALQSYLFSAALSGIRIPHRVMSYCTYGDHTVLRRFRDYDDAPASDMKILEYRATANNRDGLALAAAGFELLKRREEHKIVIVFSDGLPNDMVSGRKRANTPERYVGEAAIRDTAFQIRKLRREGVHVLGIFLGDDSELENERMIYGASFLRIRRAEDFSGTAGKRLSEMLLAL
jgi:nitric oxide reductase activation protein